mgnify:CR=1 FL=1
MSRPATSRRKAMLELIGVAIFLMPLAAVVWVYCYTVVARSWGLMEGSANIGGMPGLFVVKGFILVFAALIALQGVAMAIRSVLILSDREDLIPEDFRYQYGTD